MLQVNKDGTSYPPNSVIVGMFEGYFSNPAVGGIPPSPPIVHSLVDLLPPRSLLEVNKVDVSNTPGKLFNNLSLLSPTKPT